MADRAGLVIRAYQSLTRLSADSNPVAEIAAGMPVTFETSDVPYRGITGQAIDRGEVDFREINLFTDPVAIAEAEPGDALGFTIEGITISSPARILFNARWRSRMFGIDHSIVREYPVTGDTVDLGDGVSVPLRPMVGCLATAPERGFLSSLAPCRSTGGNLDVPEMTTGSTIWFPVRVPGALFVLGDLHASMGYGEPVGCGLECAGMVRGKFHLVKSAPLDGVRIEAPSSILFVGSHAEDHPVASQRAVRTAWRWLTDECELSRDVAIAVCAAMLHLTTGGPAGANMVASFELEPLRRAGVRANLLSKELDSIR